MALSDESLLAGLGSNDPEATAAFVRRFQSRAFGLAYAILSDREAANEVAQEVFVRVWRYAAVFDPRRGSVTGWLLTITRNLALDAARMRRPVPLDPTTSVFLGLPSSDPQPDDDACMSAELTRVRAAIDALPDEQRRALLLSIFRGLSAREISEQDDLPLGTVKTRIRLALMKLRTALEVPNE
jgi:RNA polymerase sigma-70 factor (ECF subfamily)